MWPRMHSPCVRESTCRLACEWSSGRKLTRDVDAERHRIACIGSGGMLLMTLLNFELDTLLHEVTRVLANISVSSE